MQAGSIGLLNAIERYDPSRSDEFAAYAVPTVSGEMKRFIRDRTATVRLPRGLQEARARMPSTRERLTRNLGREPTDAELAEALEISPEDVAGLSAATKETPAASETAVTGRPEPDVADERIALAGAFSALDEQEREIVYLRYVEELDRKEVARRLGMSESRLGRRTRAALGKLRTELEDDGLRRVAGGHAGPGRLQRPRTCPGAGPQNAAATAGASSCACHARSTTTWPRPPSARA